MLLGRLRLDLFLLLRRSRWRVINFGLSFLCFLDLFLILYDRFWYSTVHFCTFFTSSRSFSFLRFITIRFNIHLPPLPYLDLLSKVEIFIVCSSMLANTVFSLFPSLLVELSNVVKLVALEVLFLVIDLVEIFVGILRLICWTFEVLLCLLLVDLPRTFGGRASGFASRPFVRILQILLHKVGWGNTAIAGIAYNVNMYNDMSIFIK
jgi:hypothetical protein